jgi:hypothetical protein
MVQFFLVRSGQNHVPLNGAGKRHRANVVGCKDDIAACGIQPQPMFIHLNFNGQTRPFNFGGSAATDEESVNLAV